MFVVWLGLVPPCRAFKAVTVVEVLPHLACLTLTCASQQQAAQQKNQWMHHRPHKWYAGVVEATS